MALQLPYLPQFFDIQAGVVVPAAGYFLDTFISGTTTPQGTFSDAAGTIANTNPIVLNTEGKADIFLTAGQTYTFRLRRTVALGSGTVDTWDTIAGIPAPTSGSFVPLVGGVSMSGLFSLSGNATSALNPVPLQQLTSQINGVQAAVTAAVLAALGPPTPTGSIVAWTTASPPSGWFECNGTAVNRATNAALFAIIGTTYGVGDGSTTFNLPELRGEFVRGWDNARGVDSGRTLGSAQAELVGPHSHPFTVIAKNTDASGTGAITGGVDNTVSDGTFTGNTSNPSGAETRPRNVALMYIIKN